MKQTRVILHNNNCAYICKQKTTFSRVIVVVVVAEIETGRNKSISSLRFFQIRASVRQGIQVDDVLHKSPLMFNFSCVNIHSKKKQTYFRQYVHHSPNDNTIRCCAERHNWGPVVPADGHDSVSDGLFMVQVEQRGEGPREDCHPGHRTPWRWTLGRGIHLFNEGLLIALKITKTKFPCEYHSTLIVFYGG